MKKIRITITMTEQEAEWLEQACCVEEEFEHSKFLNHVSNLARRARHAFQQSVQPTCSTCGAKLRSGDIWWNECENCHSKIASG